MVTELVTIQNELLWIDLKELTKDNLLCGFAYTPYLRIYYQL